MAKCGPCIDTLHDTCIPGGDGWRCTCGCAVRTGYWLATTGRVCWRCRRCKYGRSFATLVEAEQAHLGHDCAWRGGSDPMQEQKSVIRQAWEQLDAEVDEIMELTARAEQAGFDKVVEVGLERVKARARGKAEILALIMDPFYKSADEISAEAGARWAARKNGTEHVTAGIGITWRPGMTPGAGS